MVSSAGSASAGRGHLNSQSLRIFSARYLLTASLFFALSLLTRSASKSGPGAVVPDCWRSFDRGDLDDLYRSENSILEEDEAEYFLVCETPPAEADRGVSREDAAAVSGELIAWPVVSANAECGAMA